MTSQKTTGAVAMLTGHDAYLWASLDDELPVTDSVKEVFEKYRQLDARRGAIADRTATSLHVA